jgi:Tfp pilus assembly protein PilE
MNVKTAPAVAQLGKFRSKLAASEAEGLKGQINQLGINMVDLMMWLVIAALLLAAALQGIGYYQQAAWTYQAKSDVASVRTFMEAQFTLNDNTYADQTAVTAALGSGDLKLTGDNGVGVTPDGSHGWVATVESADLAEASKPAFFNFGSEDDTTDPTNTTDESSNNVKASATATVTVP